MTCHDVNTLQNWCLRNKHRDSMLMTHLLPDLHSASHWMKQILANQKHWEVTHLQCGISALSWWHCETSAVFQWLSWIDKNWTLVHDKITLSLLHAVELSAIIKADKIKSFFTVHKQNKTKHYSSTHIHTHTQNFTSNQTQSGCRLSNYSELC